MSDGKSSQVLRERPKYAAENGKIKRNWRRWEDGKRVASPCDWIWVQLLTDKSRDGYLPKFATARSTLELWHDKGCPLPGTQKRAILPVNVERYSGLSSERSFVPIPWLEMVRTAYLSELAPEADWATLEEAKDFDERFDYQFVRKWSRRAHPALGAQGLPIEQSWRYQAVPWNRDGKGLAGRTIRKQVLLSWKHLRNLKERLDEKPDDEWVRGTAEALKPYGVSKSGAGYWYIYGCNYLPKGRPLDGKEFIIPSKGRGGLTRNLPVIHYARADLKKIKESRARAGVFTDWEGTWYYPAAAIKEYGARRDQAGIGPFYLTNHRTRPCPELDGRVIRAKLAPAWSGSHSKHAKLTGHDPEQPVYFEPDLSQIRARLNGWPDPQKVGAAVSNKAKGGRPRLDAAEVAFAHRVRSEWIRDKASGVKMRDFCHGRRDFHNLPLTVAGLKHLTITANRNPIHGNGR